MGKREGAGIVRKAFLEGHNLSYAPRMSNLGNVKGKEKHCR